MAAATDVEDLLVEGIAAAIGVADEVMRPTSQVSSKARSNVGILLVVSNRLFNITRGSTKRTPLRGTRGVEGGMLHQTVHGGFLELGLGSAVV